MTLDGWTIVALVLAAVGLGAAIAGRWIAGGGDWARALVVSAVALAESGLAWRTGAPLYVWLSGFLVCVALHRWVDALASHSGGSASKKGAATRKGK